MAVSPDLLLNIKAPPTAAKAASASSKAAPQASRDEASSFANVYAKERQTKPVERQESTARPVRDKPVNEKTSQETAESDGNKEPAVAVAGNEPPVDDMAAEATEQSKEAELDALLLLGLGGQADSAVDPLAGQPLTGSSFLAGLAQTQLGDAEGEGEQALLGQRSLLEGQPATQKLPLPNTVMPEELSADATDILPASLLAGEELSEDDKLSLEEGFGELLDKLDGSKDSRASAADSVINRLNPLTQAIAQQNQVQQAQRPTLVPGQPVQIQQSGWSEAVVDRVMWLSSQNLKSAEIQLDPAELGRMEVRIDMNKDQAQVTFLSPHAGVRDALEGQMQRLRDMFAQQGMTMDVNVSDQSHSRGWQGEGGGESRGSGRADGLAAGEDETTRGTLEISSSRATGERGLVDYYA